MERWKVRNSGEPTVAIVGRPNVGKSTLVNRLVGRRDAIVQEMPGVTRDRSIHPAEWLGRHFQLIDTGGWTPQWSKERTRMDALVSAQAEESLHEADLVLFVMDCKVGATIEDEAVAKWLRASGAPVVLVANKADDVSELARASALGELYSLGVGDPYMLSALHGTGSGDLLDKIIDFLEESGAFERAAELANEDDIPGVALIGRPNVGKSSLFNYLVGSDRVIVDDVPGTTRDPVDTVVRMVGKDELSQPWRLIDTAGLRKNKGAIDQTEFYSTLRTRRSLERSDVALLLFDASVPIGAQEQHLAKEISESGRAVILVANKWDLTDERRRDELDRELDRLLHFMNFASMRRISALTGRGILNLFDDIERARNNWGFRVSTSQINRWLDETVHATPPPLGKNHQPIRIRYVTQADTCPPTFTFFCNQRPEAAYMRFLERKLRESFDFEGTPLRLRFKVKERD